MLHCNTLPERRLSRSCLYQRFSAKDGPVNQKRPHHPMSEDEKLAPPPLFEIGKIAPIRGIA